MQKNLMLVSSDKTFYGTLPHIAAQLDKYFCATVFGAPSAELLQTIRQLIEERDVRGIITRGSWMVFLQSQLPLPVFPIKIDVDDVYRSINFLSNRGYRRIGIAVYSYTSDSSLLSGVIDCYRFGDLHLYISHFASTGEIEYVLDQMQNIYKAEYILGDVEAIRIAQARGLPGNVIKLESRYILDSIEQAQAIVQLGDNERSQNHHTRLLTNLISEGVLSFDSEGRLVTCNSSAIGMLQLPPEPHGNVETLLGLPLDTLLHQSANKLINIRGTKYIMNVITSQLRGETTHTVLLNDANYIQKIEFSIRTQSKSSGLTAKYTFTDMIAADSRSLQLIEVAKKYARSQGTILIHGDTGTGKEVLASSIHNESPRQEGPFVALNCATLSESLIESELFGYEKGAFTGASTSGKKGLFELAHRGTIFLDEIGELPLNLQAKLLRVLQEREIMRLGGDRVIPIDVRVLAATNRDLRQMMRDGSFREDLFYRLALLELELLPLRERPADIIPLFITFLNSHMRKNHLRLYWEDSSVFTPLLSYEWPGNIRELENLAERVVLLSEQNEIDQRLVLSLMQEKRPAAGDTVLLTVTNDLRAAEREYLTRLLERFGGSKTALCEYLGISRPTLWRKLSGSDSARER